MAEDEAAGSVSSPLLGLPSALVSVGVAVGKEVVGVGTEAHTLLATVSASACRPAVTFAVQAVQAARMGGALEARLHRQGTRVGKVLFAAWMVNWVSLSLDIAVDSLGLTF